MVKSQGIIMPDTPVCQVNCIHEDVVNRLKPDINRIEGIA